MKKLILITAILFLSINVNVNAQQEEFPCPPGAWCHPNGSGLGGGPWETQAVEDAATEVGKALKGNPCATLDLYCRLGKAVSEVIACGYGKDTPQYTLCDEKSSSQSLSKEERQILGKASFGSLKLNPNVRPVYFDSKEGKKAFITKLSKVKRGQVVKQWKNRLKMVMGYKYFTSKNKNEYAVMYYLKNRKGKTISNLFLASKKNRFYLFDVIKKK